MANIKKTILFLVIYFVCVSSLPSTSEEDEDEDPVPESRDDDGRVYKNPRNSPSAQCPRDEEQATLLGQKCLRKCSSDEDCKSKKKRCLCDGACGMSCIKPDRECPELEQPDIGKVTLTGRLFGDKAVYSCPMGYHVVGLQSRSCQADGQWAGKTPACKENIYCLQPPTIEHARHSALPEQATFDLDATVQYHCHTGYVTNGFPRAKCLAIDGQASWYGPDISCEPRSCGEPGDVPHGWVTSDCHTFGCRAVVQCGPGFELVGKAERFCQADGAWAPKELPTCVLVTQVQCPPPEAPRHGKAVYTSFAYNSVVSYECKYGYRLVGDATRRCGADKKWSGSQPACKEINCGHPGQLWNGWLENISSGTGLGASLIFRCQDGMKMEGNGSAICQSDGTWSRPLPKCLAPCVVPHVSQGRVLLVNNKTSDNTTQEPNTQIIGSSSMVQHGEIITIDCEKNYEFPSNNPAVTCNNGTWTQVSRCQPARCKKAPKFPRNGMVIAPKTEHGMKARFRCKDGFKLRGNPIMVCSFGNWTGEAPKCEEVFCPFPGFVEHGNVLLVGNMGLYDYRPYVRKVVNNKQIMYECDKGYVFSEGPPGATCIGGHWSPRELPKCTLFQHPRLRWSRRRRSITEPEIRHVRSSYLRKYNTQLQRDHIEDVYKRYNGVTKNALRHANNKILKRLDIEEMAHGDDDFTEDNLPTAVYTIFNLNGDNLRHRILAYQPIYQTDDTNEDFEETNADDLPNITVMKGGVFPEHSTGLQETTSKVVPKLNIEAINNLKHDFFEMYFDKRSIRLRKHLEKTSTEETSTQKVINQELIGEETKTKTAINHEIKKRTKRSLDDNTNDLSVIPLKINKAKSENTIANKRNIIPTGDIGSAIMSLIDRGTKIDFLDKRDKRTSRKSDKLNQTTATVPKSGRNNKGTGKDSQESNESDEDNLFSDQESGNKDVLLEKGKKRPKSPCEPIESQPYVNIEVVKFGRDPNNTFSSGTIVRVACGKGYLLNLESNSTAKCIRGRWKPEKPICEIQPCHLPSIEYGTFTLATANISTTPGQMLLNEDKELNESDPVQNGQTVQFSCDYGYNVQGPNNLRCWLGEWTVTSMPECVPAHCELPSLFGASYESGYRAGLTISHASSVNVACDPGRHPPAALNCHLGRLQPTIQDFCKPSSNSTRTIPTSEYQSGSDIVRHDISELEPQSTGSSITECGPPTRVQGSLIYRDGTQVNGSLGIEGYPHGTEITFSCIASIMGEKTTWKVICEQGEWIGKSFDCEELVSKSEELQSNNSCKYNNDEPQVVSFYNDLEITETLDFLPGTVIVSRCSDIGKYVMSGSQYRTCSGGSWDGVKPSCVGLNQQKDYAMERPPTILFRHSGGPIAQTNDGKLVVYPGTTLHMECLWMRRFGNPKWNVTLNVPDPERKYVDGWSTDPGRDSALEYQLTIENADKLDSGIYKCETPARQIHQVEIIVNAIHCPLISPTNGLIPSTLSNQLGTEVSFTCSNGNALLGSQVITCKASGNWSAPVPVCESVECGDVPLPPSASPLRSPLVSIFSRVVGGRATFACPSGWTLQGPTQTVCQPNAHWTKPFPVCKEVSCPSLPAPSSGYVLGRAPFKAGDVLQFHCNPEHTLHGRPILVCQDSGRWSDKPPTCAQACTYPGTTISGRMSSVKFYYKIGETVTFTCEAGYKLKGAPMLRCLKNRKWSNAIPLCTPTNNSTYIDPSANYNSDIDAMLSDETSDELESGISNSDTEIGISNSDTRVSKFNIPATLSSNSIKAGLTRLATSRLLRRSPLDMYKMRVNRVNKLLRRDKER